MAGTNYVQLRGYAEWAQLFEDNRDRESTHPGTNKMLKACDGQYKFNFYPATEEELQKAKDAGLSEDMYGGGQRFKNGTDGLGCGKFFQLKRKHRDIKEFVTKTGESKTEDFGGAPEIVHWNDERRNEPWNRETDGYINNGAEVVVKFSIYGEGTSQTVRLIKVGVVKNATREEGSNGERF